MDILGAQRDSIFCIGALRRFESNLITLTISFIQHCIVKTVSCRFLYIRRETWLYMT
jgi:hypothetical protein